MEPAGKIILSIIGLYFVGPIGFLWGVVLGHLLVDKTIIDRKLTSYIKKARECFDKYAPQKAVDWLDIREVRFFGKITGFIVGLIFLGLLGCLLGFLIGHLLFDIDNNEKMDNFKSKLDKYTDKYWGKIIFGLIGFAIYSPWGIFWGVIAGHFLDMQRTDGLFKNPFKLGAIFATKKDWKKLNPIIAASKSKEAKQVSFVQTMAALAAKVSKADGVVSPEEIKKFKEIFDIPADEFKLVSQTFNQAKKTAKGYERYAKQIKTLFSDNIDMLEEVIETLFKIASGDNAITIQELEIIRNISKIIGLTDKNFEFIKKQYFHEEAKENKTYIPELQEAYQRLGVKETSSDKDISKAWKKLLAEHHPDKLIAGNAPQEYIDKATTKVAKINAAYEIIKKVRNNEN